MSTAPCDEVILQNMAAIRAGVQLQVKRGVKLSAMAALIHERDGKVLVNVVSRKGVRLKGPPGGFMTAVERATQDERPSLLILIKLPMTNAVVWFDYDEFERTGDVAHALATAASQRNSN